MKKEKSYYKEDVQKKDSYPNMLDISCAGHLSSGDSSLDGALRELDEEFSNKK